MEGLFAKLGYSTVVKLTLLSLIKLVAIVMLLVLGWGVPAIATTTPYDLQSFVIEAADSLDLPLFPLTDSTADTRAKAQDVDSVTQNIYLAPPNVTRQSPQSRTLEQTTKPTSDKP
jgi:hypothetical protein